MMSSLRPVTPEDGETYVILNPNLNVIRCPQCGRFNGWVYKAEAEVFACDHPELYFGQTLRSVTKAENEVTSIYDADEWEGYTVSGRKVR